MTDLTHGQKRILILLMNAGGTMNYVAMTRRLDYPDVTLREYAALDSEGYIKYDRGDYVLTVDGANEARRLGL